MGSLVKKTAFITGAAQGIGFGIALEMAKAGANIIIGDLNHKKAQGVISELKALGVNALALSIDVTDKLSIDQAINKALEEFSAIDILVNNAGVVQNGLGDETQDNDFDLCYHVNLKSIWLMSKAISPHFQARQQGNIINIASGSGRMGGAFVPAYAASKAAAINLTQSLACTLAPSNVNVNAICPGSIWTPMWEKMEGMLNQIAGTQEINERSMFDENISKHNLFQRAVTAEDIGHAVVFLASPFSKSITGQSLNVDCGVMMN